MKKYIFYLLSIVFFTAFTQIEDPVQWSFSVENQDDNTFQLIIKAQIEEGWRVYSQHIDGDGPIPTSFQFFTHDGFELVDNVIENNALTKFDPMFDMNLSYFQRNAIFKQKILLLDDTLSTIHGELEFMVCNDIMCLPPDYVDMLFDFKKKKINRESK